MSCDMILRQLISDTSELYAQLRRAGSAGSANGESAHIQISPAPSNSIPSGL